MNLKPKNPPETAKLFMNGRSQAVRLPAEYRFEGTEVGIRRDVRTGDVILSSTRGRRQPTGSLDQFFKSRAEIPDWELDGFMEDREQGEHERDDPLA